MMEIKLFSMEVVLKKILFVHGRSQGGKDPTELKSKWIDSLKKGYIKNNLKFPSEETFQFAYYGDLLDKFTEEYESKTARSGSYGDLDPDYLQFLRETLLEVRAQHGIEHDTLVREGFLGDDHTKAAYNNEIVIATLKFLDLKFPALTKFGMEMIMRDVYLYLRFDKVRDAINERVLESLDNNTCLLVSHSLGTAVAYDILKSKVTKPDQYSFVTLGSPLGLSFFKTGMKPIENPLKQGRWYNAFDRKDIISPHPLKAKAFVVEPPVENYDGVKNPSNNHHKITGYLKDKSVARKIYELS